MEHEDETHTVFVHTTISVRDVPAFSVVVLCAAEVVRIAIAQGFVPGDSQEIRELHAAIDCLSPELCDNDRL